MLTFDSDRKLVAWTGAAIAAWALAAAAFYLVQTHLRPVGGEISLAKLLWLACAVLMWFVLPALISVDPRLPAPLRQPFRVLFWLIVARAVVEGWMLYVSLNWSPWYGIAHDVGCAIVLVWAAFVLRPRIAHYDARARTIYAHLLATAALFAPEVYFAWYMTRHFITRGEGAIYFVPNDPAHATVLNVTTAVVLCITVYVPIFLMRWFYASTDSNRPATH
jgi:hypothetical protein